MGWFFAKNTVLEKVCESTRFPRPPFSILIIGFLLQLIKDYGFTTILQGANFSKVFEPLLSIPIVENSSGPPKGFRGIQDIVVAGFSGRKQGYFCRRACLDKVFLDAKLRFQR
jgi:hypothetical protein